MRNSVEDLLSVPFSARTNADCMKIVEKGKPCPALPNLLCKHKDAKSGYTRHFSILQYETVEWLTGCEVRSKLFCWPCLLFSKENGVWNKHGFSDLNHLATAQQKHERSQSHVQSFLSLKLFGKQGIDTLNDSQLKIEISRHNEQVNKNRVVLKRLIDAICYLSKQELPLRGHDESKNLMNGGNYIEFLNVLRRYDPLLDNHLSTSTVFQGISPTVQNDLINSISSVVIDAIKNEIDSATFVAIVLDETSDVMSKSQLSTVLRFVHDGKIHERFVGFTDVSADRTSSGLYNHVVKSVREFKIEGKLVGQTYDGACVMSGHVNDLQSKVISTYPLALFTHCHAHVLHLVLKQSLLNIKECGIFFQTLSGIAAYFSKSSKKVHVLQDFVTEKLLSVGPTRWNFTSRLTNTVKDYRTQLIEFFEYVIENFEKWEGDAVVQARGFLAFLQDFQTILFLEIFSKLFGYTYVLHNVFKKTAYDILYCCKKVDDIKQELKHDKEYGFEDVWVTATEKYQVDEPSLKRLRESLSDDEKKDAHLQLFCKIIDNICMEIDTRYASLSKLEFFTLLCNEKYELYAKTFPDSVIDKLKDFYGSVFDYVRLKNELKVLYLSSEFANKPVHELVKFVKENDLKVALREVYKLAELILTVPSSTASVEHSLSAIQRINACYRGTRLQERLHGLSLLSLEKSLLTKLKQRGSFYDDVIKQFLLQKRRMELIYK